jgi:hypothetical protein
MAERDAVHHVRFVPVRPRYVSVAFIRSSRRSSVQLEPPMPHIMWFNRTRGRGASRCDGAHTAPKTCEVCSAVSCQMSGRARTIARSRDKRRVLVKPHTRSSAGDIRLVEGPITRVASRVTLRAQRSTGRFGGRGDAEPRVRGSGHVGPDRGDGQHICAGARCPAADRANSALHGRWRRCDTRLRNPARDRGHPRLSQRHR